MSEEAIVNEEEVAEEVVDEVTDVEGESSTPEGVDGDSPDPEDGKQKVPYDRFKEVNEQKKTAMEMLNLERQARIDAEARLREAQKAPVAQPVAVEMPRRDDFDNDDRYMEAWAKYNTSLVKSEAARIAEENRRLEQQAVVKRRQEELNAKFNSKLSAAQDKMPDIMESFGFVKMHTPSPEFAQALVSSEYSDKIINHLAKNPSEMAKVKAITDPLEHIKFIGSLEARMQPPTIRKKTTNAPPPPTTVNGDSSSGPTPVEMPKGGFKTQAEYIAWRDNPNRKRG